MFVSFLWVLLTIILSGVSRFCNNLKNKLNDLDYANFAPCEHLHLVIIL